MRTLSLKWKVLGSLGLALVALVGTLSWLAHANLREQFEISQRAEEAVYLREIRALLNQVNDRLTQLASWLPVLENMGDALRQEDAGALEQLFNQHWPSAQLDYDLQSAQFFSRQGASLGRWDDGSTPPPVPLQWVTRVLQDERPLFSLTCWGQCFQVAVLPLLVRNQTVGALVLTVSVAELILRFREITGRDIGILVTGKSAGQAEDRHLPTWRMEVVALSDAPNRMALLRALADRYPQPPGTADALDLGYQGRHYAIRLFSIQDLTPYGAGYFAVLSDVSEAMARIQAGVWHSLQAGFIGVTLSALLLFGLLSLPLSRLRHTARLLPLLARDGFDEEHLQVTRFPRGWGFRDEIDHLDEATMTLACRLADLNRKVEERTEALRLRMRDLDRERSFASSLLDTAQIIILALDAQGRIRLANRFAARTIGFDLPELVGRPFQTLLNPLEAQASLAELGKLFARASAHYSHETELVCATGRRLQVTWFHSVLENPQEGEAVVLSAGLDVTDRNQAERRLAWLADHDPLTGLVNRRRFEQVLQKALRAGLSQPEAAGALLYLDLDQFKLINDTLGHGAGDRVLEVFAGNLARIADGISPGRETLAARLGGDEFAVILARADREEALQAAEALRAGLNRLEYQVADELIKFTSSIGVALFPAHGTNFKELMQNADLAMYQAKALGEGRVQLFSGGEAMRLRMAHRLRWKDRIDEALETDQLFLHFQPILDLAGDNISHYEALVRMHGDAGTLIPPNDFIPVAEATGQVCAIDCRVLDLAFVAWKQLREGGRRAGFHINLSARTFQTSEWRERLELLLDTSGADPADFIFEITETAAVTDLRDARALMDGIRAKGCRFALDDFGVGFSSFSYVRELPVDLVKIDGAFIRCLAERPDNQVVVKALVDVARGFGKHTVAEFVDSAATLGVLRGLAVDYAQGFHVGRPISKAQLLAGEASLQEA